MDTVLPSRPSSYRKLLRHSFALYRKSFSRVFLFSLVLAIGAFTPRLIFTFSNYDIFNPEKVISFSRGWFLLIEIFCLIFLVGILWRIHCITRDIKEPLIVDLKQGFKKFVFVLIAALIQGMLLLGFTLIIVSIEVVLHKHFSAAHSISSLLTSKSLMAILFAAILAVTQFFLLIYLDTLFFFVLPIIAVENGGIFEGIGKSIVLVWNHWWRVISLQLTPWVCYILVIFALHQFLNIELHVFFFEYSRHEVISTLLNILIFALFIPWSCALLLIQLKDLELRKKLVPHEPRHKKSQSPA